MAGLSDSSLSADGVVVESNGRLEDELAAPLEEIDEPRLALLAIEAVVRLDLHHRQAPPLGGEILSHDFVEAAFLRRAFDSATVDGCSRMQVFWLREDHNAFAADRHGIGRPVLVAQLLHRLQLVAAESAYCAYQPHNSAAKVDASGQGRRLAFQCDGCHVFSHLAC